MTTFEAVPWAAGGLEGEAERLVFERSSPGRRASSFPDGGGLPEVDPERALPAGLRRTDAGLVPWAASGMTTRRRGSLRASWWARMISSPVSSPWAPAAGWKVAAASPVSSHRACSRRASSSSAPCTCSAGWAGCSRANPGRAAAVSATFGLYFMVQEPSG